MSSSESSHTSWKTDMSFRGFLRSPAGITSSALVVGFLGAITWAVFIAPSTSEHREEQTYTLNIGSCVNHSNWRKQICYAGWTGTSWSLYWTARRAVNLYFPYDTVEFDANGNRWAIVNVTETQLTLRDLGKVK